MRNFIGLKNILLFSAVLLSLSSLSAQQAFAGNPCDCLSQSDGDWNSVFDCGVPQISDRMCISHDVQLNGVGEAGEVDIIQQLTVGCDGDLTVQTELRVFGILINHGSIDAGRLDGTGLIQNSSSITYGDKSFSGDIENISTICSQPIGGTVGSMDTVSLLVAGAQANMGLWSLALVGVAVAVGSGIVYKVKSNKTKEE